MLVVIGVSTIAAALAPVPPPTERETTTAPSPDPAPDDGAGLVRATVAADAERPRIVRLVPGEQLALTVRSRRFAEVEVRGLGLLDAAAPLAPARFDILAGSRGRYDVYRLRPRALLARIVVAPEEGAAPSESGRRAGRSAGTSRSR